MRSGPVVSVIMACFNTDRYLADALASVLAQSLADLEVLIIDDCSTDHSAEIAGRFAAQDARVRVFKLPHNVGPAAARNTGLEAARGTWIAVVDSDDIIEPTRLQRLIDAAEADNASIAADNIGVFYDDNYVVRQMLFESAAMSRARWIDIDTYVAGNHADEGRATLGFLQPIIRRDALERYAVTYDTKLIVNEDYDLILSLLAHGLTIRFYPWIGYHYRQRTDSLSRRCSVQVLQQMIRASDDFAARNPHLSQRTKDAVEMRRKSIARLHIYIEMRAAFDARHFRGVAWRAARNPRVAWIAARFAAKRFASRGGSFVPASQAAIDVSDLMKSRP